MTIGKLVLGGFALGAGYFAWPAKTPEPGRVFAQGAPVVTAQLERRRRVVEGTGLGSLTVAGVGTDRGAVLISVAKAGDPNRFVCRVAVAPVTPDSSSAQVDCTPPAGRDGAIRDVGAKAMTMIVDEHVAATIDGRSYDTDGVADRMIALIAMNGAALAASVGDKR